MTTMDERTKTELVREVARALAKSQRLSFASDFHAFAEGRQLVLAGVSFDNFPKGPDTKRSDGDVVAHAIVMALAGATNSGDIDDWFPDKGETGVRSMEYLPVLREHLLEKDQILHGRGYSPFIHRHMAEVNAVKECRCFNDATLFDVVVPLLLFSMSK